jgi:ABC-type uncharacterized transport system ATPase subunit
MTDISVHQAGKHSGFVRAMEDLTFEVPAGKVSGFLGPATGWAPAGTLTSGQRLAVTSVPTRSSSHLVMAPPTAQRQAVVAYLLPVPIHVNCLFAATAMWQPVIQGRRDVSQPGAR